MNSQSVPARIAQKLFLYGLGAGAASLATTPAGAEIFYSGPLSFSGNTIFFDLQGTTPSATNFTGADFKLAQGISNNATNKISTYSSNYNPNSGMVTQVRPTYPGGTSTRSYVLKLTGGITIGSASNFTNGFGVFNDRYTPPPALAAQGDGGPATDAFQGDWAPGDRGFVGLRFELDGQPGVPVYGWADIGTNNFNGDAPGRFTLYGYAYENNGMPIPTGAVPEPSTIALLVAGAAGVAVLRRRKSAQNAEV